MSDGEEPGVSLTNLESERKAQEECTLEVCGQEGRGKV